MVVNLPRYDQWHLMPLWKAYYETGGVLLALVKPYQDHLVVVPHVLIFLMGVASHWNIWWEVIASFVAFAGILVLFICALRESDKRLLIFAGCVSAQVFSLTAYENLLAGYQITQNLSQLFGAWAAYLVTRKDLRTITFVCSLILAILAFFSWGGGLAASYVILIMLLFRRPYNPRLFIASIVVAVALTLLAELLTSTRPELDVAKAVRFYFVLIGKPAVWHAFPTVQSCMAAGVLVLLGFAALLGLASYLRLFSSVSRWAAFGFLALCTAAFIDAGRFDVGLERAIVSRYVTSTYFLQVAILVIAAITLLRWYDVTRNPLGRITLCACIGLLAAAPLLQQVKMAALLAPNLRSWSLVTWSDTNKLLEGIASDKEIQRTFYPDPMLVRSGLEFLRRHHLTIFARSPAAGMKKTRESGISR